MAHLEFFRCDECKKELENVDCSSNELMYEIIECGDSCRIFHFCSLECIRKFANKPYEKWKNKVKKGELQHYGSIGEFMDRIFSRKK